MSVDMDGIQIKLEGSAEGAQEALQKTIQTLQELKTWTESSGSGVQSLKVRFDALGQVKGVAATLKNLSNTVKNQKRDYSELADEIKNVSRQFASLSPKAQEAARQSAKAADAMRALSSTRYAPDVESASSMLGTLASSMKGFSNTKSSISEVASAFSALPSSIRNVILANSQLESSNKKTSNSFVPFAAKAASLIAILVRVGRKIGDFIQESNDYVENLNLFTVAMGKYADQAQEYAERVADVMGIDPSDWMRNQGVFMTLATGFGVVSNRAEIMSRNLTQLGYDISSFFNISVEESMQKLQSGISGELEPLRRLGYDLSQARLEAVALSLGIDQSVTSMNQAQKAQLRYYAIMTQVTTAQGDMARTLEAPANQLRILQAQLTQAARAIGNVFIPMLNAVLPYAIAFVKVIRWVADELASLFGFTLPEVDYSGISSVVSGMDDVDDAASDAVDSVNELKGMLAGFDELNIIGQSSASIASSGQDVSSGGDFDFELPEYDFIGDAVSKEVDKLYDQFKRFLPIVESVGEALLIAFGSDALLKALSTLLGASGIGGLSSAFETAQKVISGFTLGFAIGALASYSAAMLDARDGTLDWSYAVSGALALAGVALIAIGALTGNFVAIASGLGLVTGAVVGLTQAQKQLREEKIEAEFYDGLGISITDLADSYVALTEAISNNAKKINEAHETIESGKSKVSDTATEIENLAWAVENGAVSVEEAVPKFKAAFETLYKDTKDVLKQIYDNIVRSLAGGVGDAYILLGGDIEAYTSLIKQTYDGTTKELEALYKRSEELTASLSDPGTDVAAVNKELDEVRQKIQRLSSPEISESMVSFNEAMNSAFDIDFGSAQEVTDALQSVATAYDTATQEIVDAANVGITELETIFANADFIPTPEQVEQYELGIEAIRLNRDTRLAQLNEEYEAFVKAVITNLINEFDAQAALAESEWDNLSWFQKLFTSDEKYVKKYLNSYQETIVDPIVDQLVQANSTIGPKIKEDTDSIIDDIYDALFKGYAVYEENDGYTEVRVVAGDITKAINYAFENADWDLGGNIPEGIAEGIESNASIATDASKDLAQSCIDEFADTQQSHSPAKKYEDQARYAIQGFEYGIHAYAQDAYDAIDTFGETLMETLYKAIERNKPTVRKSLETLFSGVDIQVPSFSITGSFSVDPPSVPQINVQWYASGGFPEMGELFIANDAGPELVGSIGNRTAVANNDQIVASVAGGVAAANEQQNALLREQNALLRELLAKEGRVTFVPSAEAGRVVQRSLNMYKTVTG